MEEIEAKYLPDRDFDGFDHLSAGTWWQTQSHIYQSPFYYIDYTLAQMCAFQFWMLAKEDRKAAFDRYIRLCKAGAAVPSWSWWITPGCSRRLNRGRGKRDR